MSITVFHLAWLVPASPLFVFVAISLLGRRGRAWSRPLAVYGITMATALALMIFFAAMLEALDGELAFAVSLLEGRLPVGLYIDLQSALLLAVLSLIAWVSVVYSLGAVGRGEVDGNLFALLSLLASGALGLLIFDSPLLVLVCWELVDACAYLLTGFRHGRSDVRRAALEVFLTAKAGDLLLLLGIALLYAQAGPVTFERLDAGNMEALVGANILGLPASLWTAALLLAGLAIKGAQFPFHTWLSRTTEALPSASALIHAVTMSATVLLLIRLFPILSVAVGRFSIPGVGLGIVTLAGAVTAALATLFAVTQRDVRRAVSFFAIAQLGHVLIALGMGSKAAAVFHLATSLLFTTLLFLAAGSVTLGMRLGRRAVAASEPLDPADVFTMGGLGERQPLTFLLFLIGGAALAGSPLITAGFWSKDAILVQVWAGDRVLFWVLTLVAGVTSFGVMRLLGLIFAGAPRSQAAQHVVEGRASMILPLLFLALVVAVMGWAGTPTDFPLSLGVNLFETFLGSESDTTMFIWEPMIFWSAAGVLGLAVGFRYTRWLAETDEVDWVESLVRAMWLGWLYDLVRNGLYVDGLLQWGLAKPIVWSSDALASGDDVVGDLPTDILYELGLGLAATSGWLDAHVFVPVCGSIDRALDWVTPFIDRIDARLDVWADSIEGLGELPARTAAAFDGLLGRLVGLVEPGTLLVAQLSTVVDGALQTGVSGVGRAVRTAGLWFRPRTGGVQSYLRMASIAVIVLMAALFVFLFV